MRAVDVVLVLSFVLCFYLSVITLPHHIVVNGQSLSRQYGGDENNNKNYLLRDPISVAAVPSSEFYLNGVTNKLNILFEINSEEKPVSQGK